MDWPISFLNLVTIGIIILIQRSHEKQLVVKVKIKAEVSNATYCHGDFLSLAAGLKSRTSKNLNPSDRKLHNLAAALSPAALRLGGTRSNFLTFEPDAHHPEPRSYLFKRLVQPKKTYQNFTLTGQQWTKITKFSKSVGWNLMYDINALNWRQANGSWDPSNAELFLDFSQRNGIGIAAFELGNEPNSNYHKHGKSYSAERAVADLRLLRDTLDKFPKYRHSKIVGPEVTSISRHRGAYNYMESFLKAGGNKVADAISWHHYYLDGRTATPEQFLEPKVLEGMKTELRYAKDLIGRFSPVLPMVLSETSSCYGGGAPDLSNRFVAGFLWLDKLGLSAQAGVTSVFRQTFDEGNYGLVSGKIHDPFPDYYLSVLYKRLILGPVLRASFEPQTDKLRMYAHCARTDYYSYPKGAVVIYYLNLGKATVTLSIPEYEGNTLDLFLLTPGDADGLRSRFVKLNGEILKMHGDDIPPLTAKRHRGDVIIAPQSFGFVVLLNARLPECL